MDISHKQKYIVCTNMIFIFRLSFPRTSGSITFQFLPLVLGKVAHILSNHLIITKHLSQLLQIRLQSKLNLHAYLFLFPTINANINFEESVSFRLKLYQWLLKILVKIAETMVCILFPKLFQLLKKKSKFEAEGQEFAKTLRSLEQFIQSGKGQNNF